MVALPKIKVLIIDDSAVVRQSITKIISQDPELEVVATASDPYDARNKIVQYKPDVLTLDIEMPKMDGLTFLKLLMEKRPITTIIISSLSQHGSAQAMEALQLGAFDVFGKPNGSYSVGEIGQQLIEKIKATRFAQKVPPSRLTNSGTRNSLGAQRPTPKVTSFNPKQLILIGASTGGTEALTEVLQNLPPQMPGILIVQHIPPYFSRNFANRLNTLCALNVKEAEQNDVVQPGGVYIAPGDYHMSVSWTGQAYQLKLQQGPMVWHQRPAVDVLFSSATNCVGRNAIAGILTGMGKDGAEGLLKLRQAGASTFAQTKETCVVYGMPKAAQELGAAQKMIPLPKIANHLVNAVSSTIKA